MSPSEIDDVKKKFFLRKFVNPIWDGGGGKNYPPLAKILNNTKFVQAEGLLELFT